MSSWSRDAPAHWHEQRLDRVLREVHRPVWVRADDLHQEIGVRSHGRGVFHKEPLRGAELGDKKVFWIKPQDLIFNIVFAWEGAVAVAGPGENGLIGSHRFPCFVPRENAVDVNYLKYFFGSPRGRVLLDQNSPGSAGRNRTLDRWRLMKETVTLPPVGEQRAIADFLDRKTAAIGALCAKKERLIELLEEKRQALMTQAVTQGLDPNVPMKDSGIEWLGPIPAHWEAMQIARLVGRIEQGWSPVAENRPAEDGEWGVLKLGAIGRGEFLEFEHKTLNEPPPAPMRRYLVRTGDFLLTRANTLALVGECAVVRRAPRVPLLMSDLVYRIEIDQHRVLSAWCMHALRSAPGRFQIARDARGSSMTMAKISQSHIKAWAIAVPPASEQAAILRALEDRLLQMTMAGRVIDTQLARLREYRQALITAAVTGKIDVTAEAT